MIDEIARLIKRSHGTLDATRLRLIVQALAGCLPELHGKLRSVLQLRSGVNEPRALDVTAVALRLRVPRSRVRPLEVRALRRLRTAAQRTSCAAAPAPPIFAFLGAAYVPGAAPLAAGGVESALYFAPGATSRPAERPPGRNLQPQGVSRVDGGGTPVFVLVLFALAGVLVVGLLVADSQGLPALPRRLSRHRRRHR